MTINQKLSATVLAVAAAMTPAYAAVITYSANGANPAAIQATVTQFRTDIGGANNGVGGSFATGRREINWDAVPDTFSSPNNLPGNFFNANSARGVVMTPLAGGTGFVLSADSSNPTTTPVLFGNLDATYATEFQTFSPERLFTVLGSNKFQIDFFLPGTATQAVVTAFGVIFSDIDLSGTGTNLEAFDLQGNSIGFLGAASSPSGLSFAGLRVDGATARIARIVITTGNTNLGGLDSGAFDVVVMDDFIYGEPQAAVPEPSTLLLSGLGLLAIARIKRKRQ